MDSGVQSLFLAAIAICLILHFPSISEAADSNDLLSRICKKSGEPKSCVEVLKSIPNAASATDLRGVAKAVMKEARKETKHIANFLNRLLNSKHTNPAHKSALKLCEDEFKISVRAFDLSGLKGGMLTLDLHYALENCETCERTLAKDNVRYESIEAKIKSWKPLRNVAYYSAVALEG